MIIKERRKDRSKKEIITNDGSRYEDFEYDYFFKLEEYEEEYLSYNFNYSYMFPFK